METNKEKTGLSAAKVAGIVVAAMLLTMVGTLFIVKNWLFPSPFEPVVLSQAEEQRLERKLERFEQIGGRTHRVPPGQPGAMPTEEDLKPEPYSEEGASREIRLSEREINGMIAQNTDLAQQDGGRFFQRPGQRQAVDPRGSGFPHHGRQDAEGQGRG